MAEGSCFTEVAEKVYNFLTENVQESSVLWKADSLEKAICYQSSMP